MVGNLSAPRARAGFARSCPRSGTPTPSSPSRSSPSPCSLGGSLPSARPSLETSTARHICRVGTPVLNPWQRYCISLEQNPFVTKAFTSLVGFCLGDILAQKLEGAVIIDIGRVLHLGAYGFFLDGPVGHIWYKWLDGTCDKRFEKPKGTAAVATKTAADQIIWAPIMTCVFFGFLKLVEGHPNDVIPTIQSKVLPTVAANYMIWPAAHVISFKYVPSQQRILYNNAIAIVWNAYLSIVAADTGMDPAVLGNFDTGLASDLLGLHDVAMQVRTTLPPETSWLSDLAQMGSAGLPSASGMSSTPLLEAYSQLLSAVTGEQ